MGASELLHCQGNGHPERWASDWCTIGASLLNKGRGHGSGTVTNEVQ